MDGGLPSEESRPFGFSSMSRNRFDVSGSASSKVDVERTQQFTLQWSKDKTDALRPLFQQQWNFSPSGSTSQIEDYEVELDGVWMLQLVIDPDISRGPAVATLESWRLA